MIYGYARVSTRTQNIQRQINNIRNAYPTSIVYQEAFTGTKINRPVFTKLLERIKPGDTVVFDEVSRMSRNAEDGFRLYRKLYDQNVNLVFLKEPYINTDTYRKSQEQGIQMTGNEIADLYIKTTNEVMMILAKKQIELAFETAQKEVDYLHKRTKEGIAVAIQNGKKVGRPKGKKFVTKKEKESKDIILKYSRDFGGPLSNGKCITLCQVSRKSYYKYRAELLNEALKKEKELSA